ncbi:hypothetical protein BZM27_28035 [Paraburkholderia steynii]|uniref:Uncharacterized protein n=1 Tax=Paraburkholderia steynii TaxID=1245441 RepID=A0A4V6N9F2_9BURK|nr:hypothetical protein BZM27_28035 [Paraburkholderia steynii]
MSCIRRKLTGKSSAIAVVQRLFRNDRFTTYVCRPLVSSTHERSLSIPTRSSLRRRTYEFGIALDDLADAIAEDQHQQKTTR